MFELLGVKWGTPTYGTPSGTINWSADLGGLPTGTGVTEADLDATLQLAFNAWEAVASVDFAKVSTGAALTIGSADLASPVVGIAGSFPSNPSSVFQMTSAYINFSDNVTWAPNGAGPAVDFYAIALHEIGHVIGLDHVSDPSQIMHGTVGAKDLQIGDIQGAQFIYGTDPGDVSVPPPSAPPSGGGGGDSGGGGGAVALLLGLVALIVGIFSGGLGGAVAMAAAGKVANDSDDDDGSGDMPVLPMADAGHDHLDGEFDTMSHVVYAEGAGLPCVDAWTAPKACGCLGACGHGDDIDDDFAALV